jgi:hypothetical protein
MIFSIDHMVFVTSKPQRDQLVSRLLTAAFARKGLLLDFAEKGSASESLAYAGGGMVEFVYPLDMRKVPSVWFNGRPRLMGLGFASDDFAADTAWEPDPGAWTMNEDHILPDGSTLHIHAAGPHEHLSPFYIFVMDRPNRLLQFPEVSTGPKLTRLLISGKDANVWHGRLERWLHLAGREGRLLVGEVEVEFRQTTDAEMRASPTFAVTTGQGRVALSGSSIELVGSK